MTDIFRLFLEASVMASVMTAIVLLIRRLLAKRMHPAIMLALWGMVLIRLCVPFTIDSPLRLITIPQQNTTVNAEHELPFTQTTSDLSRDTDITSTDASAQAANKNISKASFEADGKTAVSDIASASSHTQLSVWDAAAAVWLAGIIATLLVFFKRARRFSKRLSLCVPVTDAGVLDMIRRRKGEAGVKKDISVLECGFAYSPMVLGCIKPRILIPSRFLNLDSEALSTILLHEICHIRRRDILKNYLWLLAKAIHWFNPLVWFGYECYEDDVELCRDENTASMLKTEGVFIYSMSLLKAARLSNQSAHVPSPAAALFENGCSLKTRISRLVKPRKKTKFPAALSVILALVMAAACFTTACQPTPETPPVVNKNVDIVEQVVEANKPENKEQLVEYKQVVDEQIKALGSHLEMQMQPNKQVTINVDADIISPGNVKIPVIRLKPKNYSKEQFEALAKYLTNGQPLYYMDMGKSFMSKEEMMTVITHIKQLLKNKDLPGNTRGAWKSRIKDMEGDEYTNAVSMADEKLYDGTLHQTENNSRFASVTHLKCYMGKDRAAWLDLYQSFEGNQTQMGFDNSNYGFGYNTFEQYEGIDAERINMTYEEAKTKAEEFVRAMDGEDTNMEVYDSSIVYDLDTITNYTKETSPQAYAFDFSRIYNGIDLKPVSYLLGGSKDINYDRQVRPESILVIIDDEGICQAYFSNQTEYIEIVSEDTPLLDFNSVVDTFKQYCKEKFTWIPDDDTTPHGLLVSLNVKRIELNLMPIPEKDNLENYITVPVWDFIADEEFADKKAVDQEGYTLEGEKDISIVTINAMNGSIINREQGY